MLRWYYFLILAAFMAILQSRATLTQTVVDAQQAKIERNENTTSRMAFAYDIGPLEVVVAFYISISGFLTDDTFTSSELPLKLSSNGGLELSYPEVDALPL
jgi:hypothetical protein